MRNSSQFQLHKRSDLSALDYKVLALLYQPLLGLDAHSLYLTFYHLVNKTNKNTYTHQELLDLINKKQNEFLKIRYKLEALNLLEVYQKEHHYIYFLKSPLTAKQFLLDTVFGSYLQSEIGEKNLNFLANLFKIEIPNLDEYKNITKTFDSLYEFKSTSLLSLDYELEGRKQNGGSLLNYKFNYEKFVESVPERLKNTSLLTGRFKDMITKIAFVYQFDVSDMVQIYEDAYVIGQAINFSHLNLKAKQYYESKHQMLSIKEKDLPANTIMDQIAPQVIIQKYAKTDQHGLALLTATQLIERNSVDIGIINVMLMHVLKFKDGILPNYNYLEKVLHTWLNKGVRTTEDALNLVTEVETKWQAKTKPQKEEPEWLQRYLDDLANMEG